MLATALLTSVDTPDAAQAAGGVVGALIVAAWAVLILLAGWKLYEKAGQPGWVAIVPILNTFGLLKIVHRPLWWFVLLIIPVVNVVVVIILLIDLARAFGRGVGMTLLLVFLTPIGYLMLGFGDARYELEPDPLF